MGYSERRCQLCGVSFNVGRVRSADEPIEAGWDGSGLGNSPCENISWACDSKDCTNVWRALEPHVYHDGSFREPRDVEEHIAGSSCNSVKGYSKLSAEEMKSCLQVQCIMYKPEDWYPESDDEDFVLESQHCFVSGISRGPPDEFDVFDLTPIRHGVRNTMIDNDNELGDDWATPMHPCCFAIFQMLSMTILGKVDIDGLRQFRMERGMHDIPSSPDRELVNQQFYVCVPGTEYLVSNPLSIPGLDDMIQSCLIREGEANDVVFHQNSTDGLTPDPFATLSAELKLLIILQLWRPDVANLRLASRSFQQLPQHYFRHLVEVEMPWVWEIETLQPKQIDWHKLWCQLSAADGGSGMDEQERQWLDHARSPGSGWWDWLVDDMTEEEREDYRIYPRSCAGEAYYSSKDMERMLAPVREERIAAGQQWPKSTELKGLRNRRRIWEDIEVIIERISSLERGSQ